MLFGVIIKILICRLGCNSLVKGGGGRQGREVTAGAMSVIDIFTFPFHHVYNIGESLPF